MAKAQQIIDEIYEFLDRVKRGKEKLTSRDTINFIEKKWPEADDKKYKIHDGVIIMGRMITEYIELKDFKNMMRWVRLEELHAVSKKHPDYIINYWKGENCLECGNEKEALRYLNLCYAENPEYIFTRAPFVYKFFNKHLKKPKALPQEPEDDDTFLSVKLKHWQTFFKADSDNMDFEILKNDEEYAAKPDPKHKKALDYLQRNQVKILKNILSSLLIKYPDLQKTYNYSKKEKKERMPDLKNIKGFAKLLSPSVFYVTSVYKNNVPYIGFSFSCSWDSEHGLGVMTHKDRVVDIGDDEMSFDIHRAKKDLKKKK
jgi:hypothetical protein